MTELRVLAHPPAVALAQVDATENLARQLGEEVTRAKSILDDLVRSLRRLDEVREQLRGKGLAVEVDLGDVGNAASNARRQVAKAPPRTTFAYPGERS